MRASSSAKARPTSQLVREGQTAPGGGGFDEFGPVLELNDAGQVAFSAATTGETSGVGGTTGIFRAGTGGLVEVAREGRVAPGGNTLGNLFVQFLSLNESGQVAFRGGLNDSAGAPDGGFGLFVGGGGTLVEIARTGEAAPGDDDAAFAGLSPFLQINEAGLVAFGSDLDGDVAFDRGIYLADSNDADAALIEIARTGRAAPATGGGVEGAFTSVTAETINAAGQVFFQGFFDADGNGTTDGRGLFLYDESLGLVSAAREGDGFLGSTITRLRAAGARAEEGSGFNDFGQIAYAYELADGREGVAIWTPALIPEPASAALALLSPLALRRRR